MIEVLIFLVGIFAFLSLALSLQLRETRKKLYDKTHWCEAHKKDSRYWKDAWESLYQSYRQLTVMDMEGSDSSPLVYGDTSLDSWEITGADSTPQPDSWRILKP